MSSKKFQSLTDERSAMLSIAMDIAKKHEEKAKISIEKEVRRIRFY
jgi:hypothetical protein